MFIIQNLYFEILFRYGWFMGGVWGTHDFCFFKGKGVDFERFFIYFHKVAGLISYKIIISMIGKCLACHNISFYIINSR